MVSQAKQVHPVKYPNPHQLKYRAEIDGLRAFAVLSVVAFHAFPTWLKGGFVGVDIFFVISGFLITSHIFENLNEGKFSFTDFFGRRILRIFPALVLVMTSSLAFGWFALLADEYAQLGKHVASSAFFVLNFVIAGESGYFDNAAETKPMLHLWSLAVEEQFYIIWPAILFLCSRYNFNILAATVFIALLSFYLNVWFVNSYPIETFFWPFGRFWELLSGSVLAWLIVYKRELLSNTKLWVDEHLVRLIRIKEGEAGRSTVANFMSLFGLLLLVSSVILINQSLAFPSNWAILPVLGALLVISAGSKASLNRLLLMNPVAVWFGLISYPLYLWHWPILSFLQIIEGEFPGRYARIAAVALSIVLAWIMYKYIEKPLRFGGVSKSIKIGALSCLLLAIGLTGIFVSKADLAETHSQLDTLTIKRKGSEHAIGSSTAWYQGKGDWLFLGNSFSNSVEKIKLSIVPKENQLDAFESRYTTLSEAASEHNAHVIVLVGPSKSSIYPQHLPDELVPSEKRYSTFFMDRLKDIPNLIAYDPTSDLLQLSLSEGLLYFRTDTHWNYKGAFLAYTNLLKLIDLPAPSVEFTLGSSFRGDLIEISKLTDFPLHEDDNWNIEFINQPVLSRQSIGNEPESPFGASEVVRNKNPLSDQLIWVIGDSYTHHLRPYLNATFREIHYLGHTDNKLKQLASDLGKAHEKPNLVIVVKGERVL